MKVTVALITYNRARFLAEAMDAVLAQSFEDLELLLLDNASTDETSEVVSRCKDPRLRYVRHPHNIGAVANGNAAFDFARGEYLIITHDDDRMTRDLLSREVAVLDSNPDVLLVASNIAYMDAGGAPTGMKLPIGADLRYGRLDFIRAYARGEILVACPTVMTRVAFMRKHPELRFRAEVGPASDVYLWMSMNAYQGFIHIIAEPLLHYRAHAGQDSTVNSYSMDMTLYPHLLSLCSRLSDEDTAFVAAQTMKETLVRKLVLLLCTGAMSASRYRRELGNILGLQPHEANRRVQSLVVARMASLSPTAARAAFALRGTVRRIRAGGAT